MPPDALLYLQLTLLLLAIGVAGGFLSGLLGIGGGIVFVPALFFCLRAVGIGEAHIMHIAIGTSLSVVFATSLTSALHNHKRGAIELEIVRRWGPYIVAGVIAGSFFASSVDGHTLKKIFAGLMLVIAVHILTSKDKPEEHRKKIPFWAQHSLCLLIGMLSSMIGVGGAIMNIPLMTWSGVPIKRAMATGAALGVLVALPGTLGYMISGFPHRHDLPPLSLGYISLIAVAAIIPASIFMAPFGVKAAHSLPQLTLRRIFAVVLTLVSLRMFMAS